MMSMRLCRRFCSLLAITVILFCLGAVKPTQVRAAPRASTALDIIAAVNALRATQGLAPYTVDSGLMSYAQGHAQYEASIHTSTHIHSDGTTAFSHGIQENIAEGDLVLLTPEYAVYVIWQDAIHLHPMIGYANGVAGAGVANDGDTMYYTFNVRPAGGVNSSSGKPGANATPTKIIPIEPLVTVTARADGCIVHQVGYGQSLWSIAIAYGVHINDIRAMNSIPTNSTDIYAKERLAIRCGLPTATPSPSPTVPPTRAPSDTPGKQETTPAAAAISDTGGLLTASPAPTSSITVVGAESERKEFMPLAAGLLVLAGGVLLVVLAFGLMGKK